MKRPVTLSNSLQQRLNAYAMAASAAGVGMLALAQPAEAKIIYTPVNVPIRTIYNLDFDNDGDTNFWIITGGFVTNSSKTFIATMHVSANSANRSAGVMGKSYLVSALPAGRKVGPAGPFLKYAAGLMGWIAYSQHGGKRYQGNWVGSKGVKNRYLGLRFPINNEKPHFGWARLSVQAGKIWTTLTGYAYETIPNKPIITGKTKGPDVITLHEGSLGALAGGGIQGSGRNAR